VPFAGVSDYMHGTTTTTADGNYRSMWPDTAAGAMYQPTATGLYVTVDYSNPWTRNENFEHKDNCINLNGLSSGVIAMSNGQSGFDAMVFQAAGEDFMFVWFMGPPMMYLSSIA